MPRSAHQSANEVSQKHQDWALRAARGTTIRAIAEDEGVTYEAVRKGVRRAERLLSAQWASSMRRVKMRLTHTYQQVIDVAFQQFQVSCLPEETTEHSTTAQSTTSRKKLKAQSGNPAFLQSIISATDKIACLWGVNGDTHTEEESEGFRWAGATEVELMDEEIRRLTHERQQMRIEE